MCILTENGVKRNFGELLLSTKQEPVKIRKNTVVVTKKDLSQDKSVDGETFLKGL